jgi:RES domain-containing protein
VRRYFTAPPREGFVEASIVLRLSRVVDLTDRARLRKHGLAQEDLISSDYVVPQSCALRAWEKGVEGLLVPSAARPGANNLAVLMDNQQPGWRIELRRITLAAWTAAPTLRL